VVAVTMTRGSGFEIVKSSALLEIRVSVLIRKRRKKVMFLELLAEKLIKFNDVHAHNKTFLVVRNELLLPPKTHFTLRLLINGLLRVLKYIFIVHGVYAAA
jgi:hypothetical protein